MESGNGARQRKPATNEDDSDAEEHPEASTSKSGGNASSSTEPPRDFYSKFVESLERSLNTVVRGDRSSDASTKLPSLSIEGVAEFIKNKRPQNIILMTGAGISTSAGIPDFRSPGTGLYDNLAEYKLEDPQDIFDIDFFQSQPEPFFKLAKALFPKDVKPTPCHYFARLLERKGMLRRWYTQNIDSLENLSGVAAEKVVAAHGSHNTSTCRKCHAKYDLQWITRILEDPDHLVAKCEKDDCEGVVKPDIVFFGENLPARFFGCTIKDFPNCDLLIVMGTSLKVFPFAGLVDEVGRDVPRLLINMEAAGGFGVAERMAAVEMCYGGKRSKRDVFWKGRCDDGCRKLAELLGWEEELDILIEQGPPSRSLL